MNTQLINFYATFFSVQIAILGIVAGVLFVFIQLVNTNFPGKLSENVLKNIFLRDVFFSSYLAVSILNLFITAYSFYIISFRWRASNTFVTLLVGEEAGSIIMWIFVLSLSLLFIYLKRNLSYLQPTKALLFAKKHTDGKSMSNFLFYKYGIEDPQIYYGSELVFADAISDDGRRLKQKIDEAKKRYHTLKSSLKIAADPFLPISEISTNAINKADIATLSEAEQCFIDLFKGLIESTSIKVTDEWNPEGELISHYVKHLVGIYRLQLEIAEKNRLLAVKNIVINSSKKIAEILIASDFSEALQVLDNFWRKIADCAITSEPEVFINIVSLYRGIGELFFEKERWKDLDDVFASLGWLGERLLFKNPPEEKPSMVDYDYRTGEDELIEALLTFSYMYDEKYPGTYPLLFFDAVVVLVRKYADLLRTNPDNDDYRQTIGQLIHIFCSFADSATEKGNVDGVYLATIRLKHIYEVLEENSLDEVAIETIVKILKLGLRIAAFGEIINKRSKIGPKKLGDLIMEIIIESRHRKEIEESIPDLFAHSLGSGSYDRVWDFIKELGSQMQTNFGMGFDWRTGSDSRNSG